MRYILNDSGYIETISFNNEIECNNKSCIEYIGEAPTGYESLSEWNELANINAYKVVDGNLTFDSEEDARLQELWASQQMSNSSGGVLQTYSTEEVVIGTYLGKPLYRKVINQETVDFYPSTDKGITHNISNVEKVVNIKYTMLFPNDNNWYTNWDKLVNIKGNDTKVTFTTASFSSDYVRFTNMEITLKYTKTTD